MRDTPPAGPSERKEIMIKDKVVVVEATGAIQIDGRSIAPEDLANQSNAIQAAVRGATDFLKASDRTNEGVKWVEPDETVLHQ